MYLGVSRSCDLDLVHKSLTRKLLSGCVLLRTVHLSGVSPLFNDHFFCHLLASQCLVNVENIHVREDVSLIAKLHLILYSNKSFQSKAQLGLRSLENLLLHAPNLRKVNLSAWNIARRDLEKLLEKLDHDNVDITLIAPK